MPSSATRGIISFPEFRVPTQFRQCAACFKTEYETLSQMHTCSRCGVTHYCNTVCQRNDLSSHKHPCLQRRNARRRGDQDSSDAKWKPRPRAGGEGAARISHTKLQNNFMSWMKKNTRILAWAHYQATGMHCATANGFKKCLSVKLSGHRDSHDDAIRFVVDDVDTVNGLDILKKYSGNQLFAEARAKQYTFVDGIYVFAVLLHCGPLVTFMPIGAPEELLKTWVDVPEWKERFMGDLEP